MYHIIGYQTNPITSETIFNILCDTVADLPASPVSDNGYGGEIGQGSKAVIIADGSCYLADSSRQWIYQPNPNAWVNVYTKTQIDAMFTPETLSAAGSAGYLNAGAVWSSVWSQILGLNTIRNLVAGDDMNDLTTVGIYRVVNSATAAQILNIPFTQAGGRLIVSNLGGTDRYFQIYIATGIRFYIRAMATSAQTWSHWYEYGGTDMGV